MPNDPLGDALHLAIAFYHKCDFLLTWNCRHLANAKKFGHIRLLLNKCSQKLKYFNFIVENSPVLNRKEERSIPTEGKIKVIWTDEL